uniref:Uncharacterized protein n=1 Tax=Arundo donax TaxID=35708 RepID=A0A0A8YBK8_ARUDO
MLREVCILNSNLNAKCSQIIQC